MAHCLRDTLSETQYQACSIEVGRKIPYGYEIRSYDKAGPNSNVNQYETDLVILDGSKHSWKPRVIVEAKKRSVSTHAAITYSQKALSHKTVHPYLRYGIMLGDRQHYPLPGRLYRHGAHFDFMISFAGTQPKKGDYIESYPNPCDTLRERPILTTTEEAEALAEALLSAMALPQKAALDDLHIGLAAANGIDPLLTWNCAHIANPFMLPQINAACVEFGIIPPTICTPLQLVEA